MYLRKPKKTATTNNDRKTNQQKYLIYEFYLNVRSTARKKLKRKKFDVDDEDEPKNNQQ